MQCIKKQNRYKHDLLCKFKRQLTILHVQNKSCDEYLLIYSPTLTMVLHVIYHNKMNLYNKTMESLGDSFLQCTRLNEYTLHK